MRSILISMALFLAFVATALAFGPPDTSRKRPPEDYGETREAVQHRNRERGKHKGQDAPRDAKGQANKPKPYYGTIVVEPEGNGGGDDGGEGEGQ